MQDTPETRASLLARIRDPDDRAAWEEFVQIYTPLVYRITRRRGFQDADARDLTQQVLLAVSSRVDGWDADRAKGSFRGWLFRVSRNLMVNLLVNHKRHPRGSGDSDIQELLDQQAAPAGEESATFDLEYRRQAFRWAAMQIRCEFRDTTWNAFWLTSVECREIPQVARQIGISVGAVYIARSRVLARLRQKIEQLERSS